MRVTIKFLEGNELEKALMQLDKKLAVDILRDSCRYAMEPVKQSMEEHAGFDAKNSGEHMRDSIKIRTKDKLNQKNRRYATAMTTLVGPGKKHSMKAKAQEFGTRHQVAKPFIRPALDYHKDEVLQRLVQRLQLHLNHQ